MTMPAFVPEDWVSHVTDGDSTAYFAAWTKAATLKFKLQDFGILFLMIGLVAWTIQKGWFHAPRTSLGFVGLAFCAAIACILCFVFNLIVGLGRYESPPWADSIGIPLMGVPIMFFAAIFWALLHCLFLHGIQTQSEGARITWQAMFRGHLWLTIVIIATVLIMLALAFDAQNWYIVSGFIWLYFYASIATVVHANSLNLIVEPEVDTDGSRY